MSSGLFISNIAGKTHKRTYKKTYKRYPYLCTTVVTMHVHHAKNSEIMQKVLFILNFIFSNIYKIHLIILSRLGKILIFFPSGPTSSCRLRWLFVISQFFCIGQIHFSYTTTSAAIHPFAAIRVPFAIHKISSTRVEVYIVYIFF
jgi:hypothetical protein